MQHALSLLQADPLMALAAIAALGVALGAVRLWGVALGTSGVLFVGMALGHLGVSLPPLVGQLGVTLFVYSVGLQAGPHFLRSILRHGPTLLLLTGVTLLTAWGAAIAGATMLGLDRAIAMGLYAGALTSTPALAASLQVYNDPHISVGFGVAYPLGVIGVILFVQVVPRLLRIDWEHEAEAARNADAAPPIEAAWFEITNPQVNGKTLAQVESILGDGANVSRVLDRYASLSPQGETHLAIGQYLRVVGAAADLGKIEVVLGPRRDDFRPPKSVISDARVVVTEESLCGQSLRELGFRERFGVTITRLWRDDLEFVPRGDMCLEFGDELRVVGDIDDCKRLVTQIGHRPERIHDTRFLPLCVGLLAGIAIGHVPIPVPGIEGFAPTLGLAGGPLLAGLIAGHFGRIGPLNFRMPIAARGLMNEAGLILFLASAGVGAGASFWSVVSAQGPAMLAAGALVTLLPLLAAFCIARYAAGWDALRSLGAVCGAMTCTPGLGVVSRLANSPAPATAYVAVYPMALVAVSVLTPLIGWALPLLTGSP
ncbi:Aspartate/alanine antiporter [Pirellulimonas nuda]|uniref:Aspartate/alanine antiporter n=1 Tax=Pirellulimonas nuda TaxID=2528009 RepID=A0A518DI17_9BACT|nr:TrkA C-terminal domain-containing protein [Pirellulimonas nuda]QDU91119.1 Aspartate/alanine antiporter [Pirellulimonas nuda]